MDSGSAFVLRVCHNLYPDLVRSHLLSTFVGHFPVPHNLALKAHTHAFFLKSPQLHPHPLLPQLQHRAGSLALPGLQLTRTAHRPSRAPCPARLAQWRPWAASVQRLGAAVAKDRPHVRHKRGRVALHRPPASHNCRVRSPWSEGGDPAPRGGRGAAWACRPGERPSGRAIIFPEFPAAAGGRRRAPGSGETGHAEGCCCRDSGGLRGPRGHLHLVSRKKEREAQVFPEGREERCPRFREGSLAALFFSPPSLGHGPRGPVAGASSAGRDRPGFPIPPPGRDGGVPKECCPELQFDHALAQHREICER